MLKTWYIVAFDHEPKDKNGKPNATSAALKAIDYRFVSAMILEKLSELNIDVHLRQEHRQQKLPVFYLEENDAHLFKLLFKEDEIIKALITNFRLKPYQYDISETFIKYKAKQFYERFLREDDEVEYDGRTMVRRTS